jgi:SAM-dependent methyltransferase
MFSSLLDLPTRLRYHLQGGAPDYRKFLLDELTQRLEGRTVQRILEVGPRDGIDSRRLLELNPERLVLVDLPDKQERIEGWINQLPADKVELIIGNIMYDDQARNLEPFDVVWCTGVLYHNPEQLRMIRQLFDLVKLGGLLVIESATARRRGLRDEACVEIWHNVDKSVMRRHHVSTNVTHLPSQRAIHAWLEMVGFAEVTLSSCHRRVTRRLGENRAAFIACRPEEDRPRGYYSIAGLNYDVGKAR